MNVAVSGGAGFIGSHLTQALLDAGHDVLVLDDLSTGRSENVADAVDFVQVDIRTVAAVVAFEAHRPEVLFHFAAQMDVRKSVGDPSFDADVNVGGSLNLLEACVRSGTRRMVFASTGGAIYGEQDVFPATESHPTRPVSPYGCAKAAVELYLGFYRAVHGLSSVALRFGNVYGPRQDPHGEAGVVAIFAGRLLAGEPCTVFGDGTQTRDYVYVADVVRAAIAAADSDHQGPVNVGTGVETDVNELHQLLSEAAGVDATPEQAPARPGEQLRSCIDPSRAAQVLGWRPETTLAQGLARTLEWFRGRESA